MTVATKITRSKRTALPKNVRDAILCGPVIKPRNWQELPLNKLTRAELNMKFVLEFLKVPEGELVGQQIVLYPFQQAFFYSVFDNPKGTRRAIFSIGRKNAKTVLIAEILLCYIVGPEARQNSMVCSGAMGRDQAALVFAHMCKFIQQSTDLQEVTRIIPSKKSIVGLEMNVEYSALAKDGGRAMGRSDRLIVGDEWGQINAETDDFVDALISSQGAHGDDALQIVISTQAPSDAAMLSQWIDDAQRSKDPHIVCHVYQADKGCDLLDQKQWAKANPAMGLFRSKRDLEEQLIQADRLPSREATCRNLLLNQRISLDSLFLSPSVWKNCGGAVNEDAFFHYPVYLGLDLSMRLDLTSACVSCMDDGGIVHIKSYNFTPSNGLEERGKKDRNPYVKWVQQGHLQRTPGDCVDYAWVAAYLRNSTEGMNIVEIGFDRWRIDLFKDASDKEGFGQYSEWLPFGQGYKDMSPALETFEEMAVTKKIRHGNCPLLTLGASSAVSIQDPSGNRKLDRTKAVAGGKTDPLIASLMSVYLCQKASFIGEPDAPLMVF